MMRLQSEWRTDLQIERTSRTTLTVMLRCFMILTVSLFRIEDTSEVNECLSDTRLPPFFPMVQILSTNRQSSRTCNQASLSQTAQRPLSIDELSLKRPSRNSLSLSEWGSVAHHREGCSWDRNRSDETKSVRRRCFICSIDLINGNYFFSTHRAAVSRSRVTHHQCRNENKHWSKENF